MNNQRIEYRIGDLFSAPGNSVLVHSCNAKGVWGSGVAKEFKHRFPGAFEQYNEYCVNNDDIVGTSKLTVDNERKIGCLITSDGFGKFVDSPNKILNATSKAFKMLLEQLEASDEIHMPLINSGLFNVRWKLTEKVLIETLQERQNKCVVWIQDL